MPSSKGVPSVALRPASDTSSVYTPEYTPASTPQPEGRISARINMVETSKNGEKDVVSSTEEKAANGDSQADTKQQNEEVKGKDGKDAEKLGSGATEHKAQTKCKKHPSKSKKSKKCKRPASKSSSGSSSTSSTNSDAEQDGSSSSSDSSESDSESEEDDSASSSSSEEERRKKKSKKDKKPQKSKKSRRSRKKDVSISDDSDSDDETSETSESEEDTKRSKKTKKRGKKRRKDETEPESDADNEEDNIVKAQEYLKSLGLKAKRLTASKKAAREAKETKDDSSTSDSDRRSSKKSKRGKKDKDNKKSANSKNPKFFRGDELWDNDNHQFEVKPTKARSKRENVNAYVFTVKRRFDWEGKYDSTVVDIHAQPLRDCLRRIMERCKAVSLAEEEPTIEPDMLFLYLDDMREYRKSLKANLNAGTKLKKKTKTLIVTKMAQLKCMIKYIDKDYAATKAALYPMLKEGVITFDLMWTLFRSDTIVYTPTYKNDSESRAFKAEYCVKEQSFTKGVWYEISGKYFDFDGKSFGHGAVQAEVDSFQGVRKISSLACYPIKYHPKHDDLSKQLVERGKKFVSLSGMQYKFLKGMAFMKRRGNIVKVNVNGRIMCDPATFRRINPNYPISNVKREDPDLLSECSDSDCESDKEAPAPQADACTCPDCLAADPNAFAQQREKNDEPKKRWKRIRDPKTKMYDYVQVPVDDNGVEIRNPDQPQGNADRDLEALAEGQEDDEDSVGKQDTFTDEELLIASPVILGFAFSEKLWLELSVSGIQDIQWNEGAFDSLVLPDAQKSIVQALVSAHAAEAKADSKAEASGEVAGKIPGGHQNIDDVIQGKGKGLVAVLHGTPGTGKTLTAEGIAELRRCPLYSVSAGELGTNPRELETELTKILDVAHVWGAVLLLDEADVFLEARTAQDIHRNALVSIFLRLLEYFQGILFLTTNRVTSFDEAFQSRIHIALRYQELDFKARIKIWDMFLGRVRSLVGVQMEAFDKEDLERLGRKTLNGRQIKNTVRSAQALAVNEKKPLSMTHIEKVLGVAESFERDLKGGSGYDDAMRSYN